MVISWNTKARLQLRQIYDYHKEIAGVRTARKIRKQIEDTVYQLSNFPNIGKIEQEMEELPHIFRSIVAHPNYKVIYFIDAPVIRIATIWDCRQQPEKMKENI